MRRVPERKVETLVRDVAAMIARGDSAAAVDLSGGVRLTASDLERAVREYPATLRD